ncbi:MAG TPA: NUDIX hydrolase N-terminal domain-containing protein, partial [Ktedonosporobacter sp.]|nr:NUDIX hydrolase N-terminal domain-containing protein [Ktedonosporobacter sp.]
MMPSDDTTQNPEPQTLAQKLALCADILQECSATGLHYAVNIYERERWQRVQNLAVELFAIVSARPLAEVEPLLAPIL